jgi:hypothetical protein
MIHGALLVAAGVVVGLIAGVISTLGLMASAFRALVAGPRRS